MSPWTPMRPSQRLLLEMINPIPRSLIKGVSTRSLRTAAAPLSSTRRRPGKEPSTRNTARQLCRRLQNLSVGDTTQPDPQRSSRLPVTSHHPTKAWTTDILEEYKNHVADNLTRATGSPENKTVLYSKLRTSRFPSKGDLHLPMRAVPFLSKLNDSDPSLKWLDQWRESDLVEKPVAVDGVLVFFFKSPPLMARVISEVLSQGEEYGFDRRIGLSEDGQRRKRMVIDFSSPNIAKPFHAGHLRSTLGGAFLANLYKKQGWDVVRINYLGDWGKQFGLLAVGFERYGDEAQLQKDPIGHLYDVYVKINRDLETGAAEAEHQASTNHSTAAEGKVHESAREFFRKLEGGDVEALQIWRRFRELSIEKYQQTYQRLNISFDNYAGESGVDPDQIADVLKRLKATGCIREDRGALILDFPDGSGYALLQKGDGTSVYLTRDMAEAIRRYSMYKFDRMLYVVGAEQTRYFRDLLSGLKLIGEDKIADNCVYVPLGQVKGMSTRRGTAKFLDDILDEARKRMYEVMTGNPEKFSEMEDPEKTADALGVSALAIQDMKSKRKLGYDFDLDRMTSFIGDTGPYLQYTHTRLSSIHRRAAIDPARLHPAEISALNEESALQIIRTILRWPSVLREAMDTGEIEEPAAVVTYLFQLAHLVNSSYRELRVLGVEPEVQLARLGLYEAARHTLASGLKLLGLTPLERM